MNELTGTTAREGGKAFMGGVFGKIAALLLHVLLGRVLGPANYGIYSLGRSVAGISQFAASLGLNQGIVRFCAMYRGTGDKARLKGTILAALWISAASGILAAVIVFIFSPHLAAAFFREPRLTLPLRIFALSIPFCVLTGAAASFTQSFQRIDYQQLILNIFRPLANLIVVGAVFLFSFRLIGAAAGFFFSWLLSFIIGGYLLLKLLPAGFAKIKPLYNAKSLLRYSIPTFFTGLSYLLLTYTDRIMLGYFGSAGDVGIYNAASTIALQLPIFLAAFISIFTPLCADLYNREKIKELNNLFKTTSRWVILLTIPLFLMVVLFSRQVMLVFGAAFAAGALSLQILALSQLVNAGTGPVGMVLQMTGKQDIDFVNGVVLLGLNIGLNLLLIPVYGSAGAAAATCLSIALMHILRLIEVYKILGLSPYDLRFLKPVGAGVISAAVVVVSRQLHTWRHWSVLIAEIFLLLAVYAFVIYKTGLDTEDRMVYQIIRKKFLKGGGVSDL